MLAHKEQFDSLYADLRGLNLRDVEFPLQDIGKFHWNRGPWRDTYYGYFYRRFTSHILSRLRLQPAQSVLIIGCGFGFDEKNIQKLIPDLDVWSLDISTEMLKLARVGGSPGNFCLGVAEALPFPADTFDRVLAREVIEHVAQPEAMLREIHRVLKPNGIAIVTTENEQSLGPTNLYDSRVHPWLLRLLGQTVPEPTYKDEAPDLVEVKRMLGAVKLTLVEYFWDGALYKYLIELSGWLKGRLVASAHFFSCLENNRLLAFLFCDQVKFVLLKPGSDVAVQSSARAVKYACTRCEAALEARDLSLVCTRCGQAFREVEGFFDFVPRSDADQGSRSAPDTATSDSERPTLPRLATFANFTSSVLRHLYVGAYLISACLGSLFVPKNRKQLSRLLPADSVFQSFLGRAS